MATMNNKKSILILSIIMIILESCKSWPSGAPEKTCPTLLPRHGGQPAKEANESPYMLEQSNSQYRPGDQILVVLKSPSNIPFKGLIVQALDPETGKTIGKFSQGTGLKVIDSCSAVTHSDNRNKKAANLVWNAPLNTGSVNHQGGLSGQVVFRGTVVRKYDTFFKGLISVVNPHVHV
ncbi:putative defense protein 3 [Dermatophagoides pteronyssinus]|uniref:Ferric-chelate reductase 1 n=1 Tax=Dermatophagoides pteronyssinus TaxID=6956 RepID=A0A6P6Y238_DERPT|nr:putative ferric-chelate reductase 1 [Dermatophagoides pteronyssinus]